MLMPLPPPAVFLPKADTVCVIFWVLLYIVGIAILLTTCMENMYMEWLTGKLITSKNYN